MELFSGNLYVHVHSREKLIKITHMMVYVYLFVYLYWLDKQRVIPLFPSDKHLESQLVQQPGHKLAIQN